jgi:hypothetical protein
VQQHRKTACAEGEEVKKEDSALSAHSAINKDVRARDMQKRLLM